MKIEHLYESTVKSLIGQYVEENDEPTLIDENTPHKAWKSGFECTHEDIESLIGCPHEVKGDLDFTSNKIKNLAGISKTIRGNLWLSNNPIESLKDIAKNIKYIKGKVILRNCPVKSNILGLLKIDGLTGVLVNNNNPHDPDKKLMRAVVIINKYLDRRTPNDTQLLYECQDALIDAGLEDFAEM